MEGATERILVGHFLTRYEAARRAHISTHEVQHRPDLLRLGGRFLEEVYCEFQFGPQGVRRGLGSVVRILRKNHDDEAIADWLTRPNESLGGLAPRDWLRKGDGVHTVVDAAASHPPFD